VHIVGGSASGKTTLAKHYARKAKVPHFELDKMNFTDVINRKFRPEPERDELIKQAADSEEWVIEGVYVGIWVAPAFQRAERILVLNTRERIRNYRLIKRQVRWLTGNLALYDRFLPTLIELLRFNRQYTKELYQYSLKVLSEYGDKVVICNNNRNAESELMG
jgi:adenylate kinase family enzyme